MEYDHHGQTLGYPKLQIALHWIIAALVGLHVIGALAEHFYFKNDNLKRMLRAQS